MPDDFNKSNLQNIANHPVIQHLRKRGPLTVHELPEYVSSEGLEGSVGALELNHDVMKEENLEPVYYLYGEERRAVQKFIEVNPDFVGTCISGDSDAIKVGLESFWWQIFREEWVWNQHDEEEQD
ncbi:MAG: hypothetical protein ABEK59_07055 [Halobacteria archaeon]